MKKITLIAFLLIGKLVLAQHDKLSLNVSSKELGNISGELEIDLQYHFHDSRLFTDSLIIELPADWTVVSNTPLAAKQSLNNGIYFIRILTSEETIIKKLSVIK